MAKPPAAGSPAPPFSLPGVTVGPDGSQYGDFSLDRARGNPLVLVFYPGDNTPVCTRQLCSYTTDLDRFRDLGAAVWGVSPQDTGSHESFARQHGLAMPLLADTDRAAARAYGIAVPGLGLRRSVFVLDDRGTVRWRHVALAGLTFQSTDTLAEQVRAVLRTP
ncbi:peroxiredoxin [Streptomyces meridianus]|uniref:thioredoxin-dependent peroxiredoxin n=1 Tax=Streptomyces meridianus TaxID=2938945 RepID=A0ABT0XC30_9ACTN|nr:peroxiredoxin [Streptomyces meridianus]MCM2580078.1 peroxiredoxin [Streptomyces meridianus]